MKTIASSIEILESRIAPATLTGQVLTYTDIDGDHVAITISKGTLTSGMFTFDTGSVNGDNSVHQQLRLIDVSGAAGVGGAGITMKVTKAGAGDGLAAVGRVNAGANDLGAVSIKGDLGVIDCGSNTASTPAIKRLSVRSIGAYELATQGAGDLESDIHGALGSLKVSGDVKGANINVLGGASATLGPVSIGGSLIGGSNSLSGVILSSGDMSAVKIGHDVQGGSGVESGVIGSDGKLAGVTLGGSLIGGSNNFTGEIFSSGNMGAVKIGHDVHGGSGIASGFIESVSKLAGVILGGSLIGGSATNSGEIFSIGDMGAVKIGGDLTGASIASGSLDKSGLIESSAGRIASVTLGGSIIAGTDNSSGGSLTNNASIRAAHDIGALKVTGGLIGSVGSGGDITKVIISAKGQAFPTATADLAIGKISIGGRLERAQVLAGYDTSLSPTDGHAQIGAVSVGGDGVASDLVAGVQDDGSAGFGDAGDTIIGGGTIAKIASITIKGVVIGTPAGGDQFGFVSHAIGSFKANGVSIPIVSPVPLSPITSSDVTIRLV